MCRHALLRRQFGLAPRPVRRRIGWRMLRIPTVPSLNYRRRSGEDQESALTCF
jgi:hypothetical protein